MFFAFSGVGHKALCPLSSTSSIYFYSLFLFFFSFLISAIYLFYTILFWSSISSLLYSRCVKYFFKYSLYFYYIFYYWFLLQCCSNFLISSYFSRCFIFIAITLFSKFFCITKFSLTYVTDSTVTALCTFNFVFCATFFLLNNGFI